MNTLSLVRLLVFTAAGLPTFARAVPTIGPDYAPPNPVLPAQFRDAGPAIDHAERTHTPGEWWRLFHDPALETLEERALAGNQDLRAAVARVEQARAVAGIARGSYWPAVAVSGEVARDRTSATTDNPLPNRFETTYRVPVSATWELDLFGRVRRLNESARAEAAAADADFEAVRLSLAAEVAVTYFSLGAADAELALVTDTVRLRRRALDLVAARVRAGNAADVDAARAETELALTEAEAAATTRRREALRNALAVLAGDDPVTGAPEAAQLPGSVPVVPGGLPAAVLQRRPDIAAAERRLAAANARIGVAKAAYFPAISLTGSAGYASGDIDRLFDSGSRLWSIGPQVYLPLFQGGRIRAGVRRSRAAYDEAVAGYREHVLVALREVQDALTASQLLADEAAAQDRAVGAAKRTVALAQRRYDAGFVAYLEVIDAQRTALGSERAAVLLRAQRLNAAVALIKALGGGWSAAAGRVASN
jgi:multidrug efflux system outer membrane protein